MKVEVREQGEVIVVLDEVFDFKKVDAFRKSYEQIDPKSAKVISIDFGHTKYMDSSALGMLLNVQHYFKESCIPIKIKNPNDQIRKIMSISRFDQKFAIE